MGCGGSRTRAKGEGEGVGIKWGNVPANKRVRQRGESNNVRTWGIVNRESKGNRVVCVGERNGKSQNNNQPINEQIKWGHPKVNRGWGRTIKGKYRWGKAMGNNKRGGNGERGGTCGGVM